MRKIDKSICYITAIVFVCMACFSNSAEASSNKNVLVTTFPIYQVVRNVTQGREGLGVELMLSSQLGCPHDYTLTPQDMKKIARADILVINGLGMEEFLGAPIAKANPGIVIADSSVGIGNTMQYSQEAWHGHEHGHHDEHPFEWAGAFELSPGTYFWSFAKVDGEYADPAMKFYFIKSSADDPIESIEEKAEQEFEHEGKLIANDSDLQAGKLYELQFDAGSNLSKFAVKIEKAGVYVFFTEHMPSEFEAGEHFFKTSTGEDVEPVAQEPEHAHGHHHSGTNPHLFASPRMVAVLAMNVAGELSKADPEGAAIYFNNAKAYADKMNKLADEMANLGKHLNNNRIIQPHGVFDYLARDMGLEVIAVMQAHGQEPSAAEMVNLVKLIKEKKVGAVFTEPQYSDKVGKTLSKETGVPTAVLDPVATGPEDAPLDYYETVMRKNMQTFKTVLGGK